MKQNISVIIVGSGISGFTAAVKLIENGFSDVTILEAEDRIGGRIFTTEFGDGLIDLGAQWCHGIDGNIVHELSGSEAFAETRMDFSKMIFARSSGVVDGKTCESLMKLCDKSLENLKTQTVGTVDEVLTSEFLKELNLTDFDRKLAREILQNFKLRESSYCGCESLQQISLEGYQKFKDCDGPTWLNWKGKGYKTIFNNVLKKSNLTHSDIETKILFKKEVTNIFWRNNSKTIVKCADGSIYHTDYVIVTVSLGVFKQTYATLFTPELPIEKQNAIDESSFGAVGKIFLKFDEQFWPHGWVGFSLLWSDEDLERLRDTDHSWLSNIYCFYTVDFLPNVLLGRLAGDKIGQMESCSDEEIIKGCQYIFHEFFQTDIKGKIVEVKTSKWKSNPHFYGTYSYKTKADSSTNHLAEPLYDDKGRLTVLFAGESTHDNFFSTVHGAIETGIREADRLNKFCRAVLD